MKRKIITALFFILIMSASSQAFSGREKWQFQPEGPATSGIALSGNAIFFGTETGNFYALDKNTGRVIWQLKTENTICGTPSIVGSNVVFAQEDGEIRCVKISDGSSVWSVGGIGGRDERNRDVNDGLSDGTTAGGGMVFVSKADKKLHALRASDGKELWTYTAGSQGLRSAPAYSDGLVFLGEYDGIFSIIDAKTGKRLNGGGAGGAINTPAISGGNVYFSSWDGSVNAVKIKDVIPLWDARINDAVSTRPAVGSGLVVVGTGRGAVYALNGNDGSVKWHFSTENGNVSSTPVIADGLVFAGAETGSVLVIDASTGRKISELGDGQGIIGDPAYSEGVLYFGKGTIFAFE